MNRVLERASGATLFPAVYKRGPQVAAQGVYMSCEPTVFAKVLAITEEGCVLPMLDTKPSDPVLWHVGLESLRTLWWGAHDDTLQHGPPAATMRQYHMDVLARGLPEEMEQLLWRCWRKNYIAQRGGTVCRTVHGDTTLENLVFDSAGAWWIDPCLRPVPRCVELDLGKIMQTVHGYHPVTPEALQAARVFLDTEPHDHALALYFCATHIARVWARQVNRRDWALQKVRELCAQ